MKINNKGFTLIELLAVVVILLAISVIAISSINSAIERSKVKEDNAKKEVIIEHAKLYYEENKNNISNGCINIGSLGLSDEEILDSSSSSFGVCVCKKEDNTWEFYKLDSECDL